MLKAPYDSSRAPKQIGQALIFFQFSEKNVVIEYGPFLLFW